MNRALKIVASPHQIGEQRGAGDEYLNPSDAGYAERPGPQRSYLTGRTTPGSSATSGVRRQ
ncbi:MAG: hypothetical protein ACHQ01_07200 [Candidatus Limnocylindrales bacterium]